MSRYSYSLRSSQRYNAPEEDIMNKALDAADDLRRRIEEKQNAKK